MTTPEVWIPMPVPTVEFRPGAVIELAHVDHPDPAFRPRRRLALSAWELAAALSPVTSGVTELTVRADEATDDELRLLAVFLRTPVVTPDGRPARTARLAVRPAAARADSPFSGPFSGR